MTLLTLHHLNITRYFIISILGFSIPFSTAATNITIGLVLLLLLTELILISNNYKHKWLILRDQSIIWLAIALFSFMLLAILYTTANWSEINKMLLKYRELLLIPLFFLLIRDRKSQQLGLYSFIAAMILTLFLSYVITWTGWHIGKGTVENPFVFKNHITQGILMSLVAYFLAIQSIQQRSGRTLRIIFILLAMINIIFMTQGRTGYLVLGCLILLLIYQLYYWRGLFIGVIALSLASTMIYIGSDQVKMRIDKISDNVTAYKQGESETSIGFRLEFYQTSLQLIAKHPFFGTGTGSFHQTYTALATAQNKPITENPHNEYLMIAVQWGLIGLSLFIGLLYIIWRQANNLSIENKRMLQGLLITMGVGCLVNSLLLDFTEGHAFVFLLSVFMADCENEHPLKTTTSAFN